MDYIHINKLITTSIYKQIASSIKYAIETGRLKFNDKLPTEKEICQTFSISQTAVKMAYEQLIKEQLIMRIKGKGTYVTNRPVYFNNMKHFYENEILIEDSKKYEQRIILFDKKSYDYSANRALNIDASDDAFQVSRVISVEGNPVVYQKIYLPKKYYKSFEEKYHEMSNLYQFIEGTFKHRIDHLHNTFNAVNATPAEALLLNLSPDDAIYYVRTRIMDNKDRVLGYVAHFFPGDFTEFEVVVHAS